VYSYTGNVATVPQTLLEEEFLSTGLPTGWTSAGYYDNSLAGNIKLASGKNYGSITTPSLNLSIATTLTVRAKQYGSDNGTKLTVKANGDSITSFATAVDNQTFTTNIPIKTSASTISLSTLTGVRAYIDYVKVATQGISLTPTSVSGYPKLVGNILNYSATGLQSDSTYYYTVTPQGNSATVSDQIKVHTLKINSGFNSLNDTQIVWYVSADGLQVGNIPADCQVYVMDLMGKQFKSVQNTSSMMTFDLLEKGLYLLQIRKNQLVKTYKVIY
jgi:hypothetical protein